jgi:hypothetical protein
VLAHAPCLHDAVVAALDDPDDALYRRNVRAMRRAIEICHALDIPKIVIHACIAPEFDEATLYRYNKMFYKAERHSERPDHAMDFRRESRITLTRLTLPPRDEDMHPEDRRILLVYPKPQLLTRTTTRMDYLDPGSRLEDFEIMYLHNLLDTIHEAQNPSYGG